MSDEEMRKKMEFIVNQQAQFAADMGALKDRLDQLEGVVGRMAQVLLDHVEATDRRFDDTDRKISALVDAQIRTEETVKRTNEDLRNLIAVVDRYFSEGRNGK